LPEGDLSTSPLREAALRRLDPLYPDPSPQVNRRLSLLLPRLAAPEFVSRTVKLLEQADDPTQRFHYLYVLRNVLEGWTPALRESYFAQLARAGEFIGGEGMPTFRRLLEKEALAGVPDDQRANYSKLLLGDLLGPSWTDLTDEKRPFVREWTLDDFPEPISDLQSGRDRENGKRMFAAARCIACHRMEGQGGVSGPDLSAVAHRFSPRDMLTAILDPSRVVAENYQSEAFTLRDGRVLVGRVAAGDYRSPELLLTPDLLMPEKTITIAKSEIESHQPSPISPMPSGLVDTLTRDEILDLLAYLLAGE
jgi:putative heme-binding domain-containing protein